MRARLWWLLAPILILAPLAYLRFAPDTWIWHREIARGNRDIAKIRNFQKRHGRLPVGLAEVGFDEEQEGMFYRRCDENRFLVWFGAELGESMTYDSSTGSWVHLVVMC